MRTSFRWGKELEAAGRLGTLLAVWLKAFEVEKLTTSKLGSQPRRM